MNERILCIWSESSRCLLKDLVNLDCGRSNKAVHCSTGDHGDAGDIVLLAMKHLVRLNARGYIGIE